MLTTEMITAAATAITSVIAIAVAGGMGIFGSVKGLHVGLGVFSRLVSGR